MTEQFRSESLNQPNESAYLRLVALWVLAESVLGGVLHGLKFPVTGLLVGGSAMLCIILIAWYFPNRASVLKAMTLVMLMKFSLSPHSPFPAYLAVLFQGVAGQFLLRGRRFFLIKCLVFGFMGMMESALQRLLVLVFISGTEIWEALDTWVAKVGSGLGPARFSHILAIAYLFVHALAGLALGYLGWKLVSEPATDFPRIKAAAESTFIFKRKERKSKGVAGPILSLLAFAVWLSISFDFFPAPGKISFFLPLILRMVWLYGLLVYILVPLPDYFFKKFLSGKTGPYASRLEEIRDLLPEIFSLVRQARIYSKEQGLGIRSFFQLVVFNILQVNEENHHSERG